MSESAETPVTTHDDGSWIRTAIVVTSGDEREGGSIAIVNEKGERIALVNMYTSSDNDWFAADVIDIDGRFQRRRALVFDKGMKQDLVAPTSLIGVDFRKEA